MDGNSLSGSIPFEIGRLSKLNELFVISPSVYFSFSSPLQCFLPPPRHMNNNSLSGSIPYQLGYIHPIFTMFAPSLPSPFPSSPFLTPAPLRDLQFNSLSGDIPSEFGGQLIMDSLFVLVLPFLSLLLCW